MRTLIVYISIHHGNTEKIARVLADVLDAELIRPREVDIDTLSGYDLVGFGSGIYFWKHHKTLLNLVDKLPEQGGKSAFIFSTRGIGPIWLYHRPLRKRLLRKDFKIADEFSCKGLDTVGPLKFIGGLNRGRPNDGDLRKAKLFAERLKNRLVVTI